MRNFTVGTVLYEAIAAAFLLLLAGAFLFRSDHESLAFAQVAEMLSARAGLQLQPTILLKDVDRFVIVCGKEMHSYRAHMPLRQGDHPALSSAARTIWR